MSKIIASAAIRGAYKLVDRAENEIKVAVGKFGKDKKIEFPNTDYYLPIIYGITGIAVKKLGDMGEVLNIAKGLLPPHPSDSTWLPYLGGTLDAGMATLFAEEMIEALKYLEEPCPYLIAPSPSEEHLWIGAADDKILRERGIEFVDGTAPGFAACVGSLPDAETAVKIAQELQEKSLYVFMCAEHNGKGMAEQLKEKNVQMGWETRLVPFGSDITAAVFALGFAARAAMSFGGVKPGDFRRILMYNRHRVFAFVLALGEVTDEWYATAAGAINYGFPVIADTDIPAILPRGICLYEHVVPNISHSEIVAKALEVRGLKVVHARIDIPVSYAPAFEGERIKKDDVFVEMCEGRLKKPSFEFVTMKPSKEVEDGRVEIIGPDLDEVKEGETLALGIVVEVAGARFQKDFEPILERQIHKFINEAQGIWHMGQRNINWVRISKAAFEKGFRLRHFGNILHAKLHEGYSGIVDRIQVKIYTDEEKARELLIVAKNSYVERDERTAGMTDEGVDIFYSCALCQSFAPTHVCIVTPERPGLCGAYSWLDCKASYEIDPYGANKPIKKGEVIDERKGAWKGINEAIVSFSQGKIAQMNAYTMLEDPMTSCGCFESISCLLPLCNGIMTVDRDSSMLTPCGMKFSTLAGSVGGGLQTPGFIGHSKLYITSKKFISGDGGLLRLTWLPKSLKEQLREKLEKGAKELGVEGFVDMIADETVALTQEEVYEYMQKVGHPALKMEPIV
ncbi:CO dehydrogenase/CO-methylating acetyl-CoA synthase complex subunit beta [Candidatus Desantisbacteria bacterium CG2_30_40_21]|uniref:CO-methylating acetyl-CoA synthase n=2 Tax=unclassified Candidatus Desantisiibacteriota TaxID=3106372 RepID=A0A2H0A979_9BACT|nr:MAG: CO dehydrogenase/CO-methylating acetyl-CoA synthase complex subunit beta [Candidatus Desantisbacteria bacterium CG2_30_40_21]PIP41992.1 MAG: CO dehydrogenase/CO-methylating acetyl-CoA synthase complex subunit beta [Candidatus Desantisbacteria bacterium CG23_combo_of_CG06-09_8_20_14_all_40_23]